MKISMIEQSTRVQLPGLDRPLIRVARSMPGSSVSIEYTEPEPTLPVDPADALMPIPLDDGPILQVVGCRA